MQTIEITQRSRKPVDQLFDALADHNRLSQVFGVPVRRIRDGADALNGTGSVRKIGLGPIGVEETVTALEPNRSIEYRISKGGWPIRNHQGRLDFSGDSSGSRVTWTIQIDSMLPLVAPAVKLALGGVIRLGLKRIA